MSSRNDTFLLKRCSPSIHKVVESLKKMEFLPWVKKVYFSRPVKGLKSDFFLCEWSVSAKLKEVPKLALTISSLFLKNLASFLMADSDIFL